MALGPQVVDLIGLDVVQQIRQLSRHGEIAVIQEKVCSRVMHVLEEMVDPVGVEGARAADEPVDLVSLAQEQLREVRAILARDARDERFLHRFFPFFCSLRDAAGLALSVAAGVAWLRTSSLMRFT